MRAGIAREGIRYKDLIYSNDWTKAELMKPSAWRMSGGEGIVEIKIDPLDLGAISVLDGTQWVSVPCVDQSMKGCSLEKWSLDRLGRQAASRRDVAEQAGSNHEARSGWREEAALLASSRGVSLSGKSPEEIERMARGLRRKPASAVAPFVSTEEYSDPLSGGFEIGERDNCIDDMQARPSEQVASQPQAVTDPLAQFRASALKRNGRQRTKGK